MLTKGRSNVSYKKSTSKNFLAERILPSKTIKRTSIHSGYGVTRLPFAIRLVFIVAPFKHTCGFRFDRLISLYFSATIVETSSTHNWPIAVWGLFANINSTCIKRNSLYLCNWRLITINVHRQNLLTRTLPWSNNNEKGEVRFQAPLQAPNFITLL